MNYRKMHVMKKGYVYILFNRWRGTLYVGVTSDLAKRIYEHKSHCVEGFTKKYSIDKLGYFEELDSIETAILREKQIKNGSRAAKIKLIESINPKWKDMYPDII